MTGGFRHSSWPAPSLLGLAEQVSFWKVYAFNFCLGAEIFIRILSLRTTFKALRPIFTILWSFIWVWLILGVRKDQIADCFAEQSPRILVLNTLRKLVLILGLFNDIFVRASMAP